MKKMDPIGSFLSMETPEVRIELKRLYQVIKKAAPKATEKLAWGMPTFFQEGNLIHFCSFKNHMSLFPGAEAMRVFKPEMKGFTTSKGTMQIPYGTEIPVKLITKIVQFNLKGNLAEAKLKKLKKKKLAKNKREK